MKWGAVCCWFLSMCSPGWASDCLEYKLTPKIVINTPDWSKEVVQPKKTMDLWHGVVVATLVDNYDIVADVNKVDDGFCVGLKTVNAVVGYENFRVNIDIRHKPETCEYKAVLAHEDKHIKTYLSVIDDFKKDLHDSVYAAADSVMPVWVESKDNLDDAIEVLNNRLQVHPELIVVKQKIKAAEEIKNKQVDYMENGADLKKCGVKNI